MPKAPAKRPEPPKLTVSFDGKDHPFRLGVNGWCKAEEKYDKSASEIWKDFVDKPRLDVASFIMATGLTTAELVWSEEEAGAVVDAIGMRECVRLFGEDLAWLYGPRNAVAGFENEISKAKT